LRREAKKKKQQNAGGDDLRTQWRERENAQRNPSLREPNAPVARPDMPLRRSGNSQDHEDDTRGCHADDRLFLGAEMSTRRQCDGAAHADSEYTDPEE
jgi:hypothetical protein